MPLRDWIKEFYIGLLTDGWKLNDIEEIDMIWYAEILSYREEKAYIGEVEKALDIF